MIFEQGLMVFLKTALIVFAVAAGIYNNTYYEIDSGVIQDLVEHKPVLMTKVQYTQGLMSVTTLPTKEFVHLKAATIAFSKDGTLISTSSLHH